jgi:hypothetical protein
VREKVGRSKQPVSKLKEKEESKERKCVFKGG